MKAKQNALIIGCGKMGCFFDQPGSKTITTHAHALSKMGFDLCFYDSDLRKSQEAAGIWHGKSVQSVHDQYYDIVVLCSSTGSHFEILSSLKKENFNILIVEKPFCTSKKEAQKILEQLQEKLIYINYSRLFIPEYQQLKSRIEKNEFGKCLRFTGIYSRGFQNNASHWLSMVHFLTECHDFDIQLIKKEKEKISQFDNYNISMLNKEGMQGQLLGFDDSYYSVGEMSFYFEKAIVRLVDFGQKIQLQTLNSEKSELNQTTLIKIDYNKAIIGLYDRALKKSKSDSLSSIQNSLFVHQILSKAMGEK